MKIQKCNNEKTEIFEDFPNEKALKMDDSKRREKNSHVHQLGTKKMIEIASDSEKATKVCRNTLCIPAR
jgi:hypothetical protein